MRYVVSIIFGRVPALVAAHLRSSATATASRGQSDRIAEGRAEDEPLFLPSSLNEAERALCVPEVTETELFMRDAQLHESLDQVRALLHMKSGLLMFKKKNVRHQRQNTRARNIIDTNQERLMLFAVKYRAARRGRPRRMHPALRTSY